uniref:uncharacterized protein LOC122601248 n=1 Tax=Erigeron canadensis TaxID=72917 RepID=UPI001CB9511A|nr:uncharacterized protein LOC122601248 [Erigeron canadensis]
MMQKYMDMNDKRHDSLASYTKSLNEKISNLNQKVDEGARNQQAAIKEMERRIDRWIEQNTRKDSSPMPRPILQGSSSSNPNPSQKYQPPIGRNENVNAVFTEGNDSTVISNDSCESSNQVQGIRRQNGSETDKKAILESVQNHLAPLESPTSAAGSPSDGDLGTQLASKCKMEDGDNLGRSEKVQNPDTQNDEKRTPQANEDAGSFLIPCTINDEYFSSALADLGSSSLKPANMSIRLADQTYRQPKGIVEQVHVRVKDLEFWTEFVVLDSIDGIDTPIILGRPFLHIADVTVHVLKREITLSDGKNVVKVSDLDSKLNIIKAECLSMEVANDDQDGGKQTRKGKREG